MQQEWSRARCAGEGGDPVERVLTPISGDGFDRAEESSSRAPSLPLPHWAEGKRPTCTTAGRYLPRQQPLRLFGSEIK